MIKMTDLYPEKEIRPEDMWACTIIVPLHDPKNMLGEVTIVVRWCRKDVVGKPKERVFGHKYIKFLADGRVVPVSGWEDGLRRNEAPVYVIEQVRAFLQGHHSAPVEETNEDYED